MERVSSFKKQVSSLGDLSSNLQNAKIPSPSTSREKLENKMRINFADGVGASNAFGAKMNTERNQVYISDEEQSLRCPDSQLQNGVARQAGMNKLNIQIDSYNGHNELDQRQLGNRTTDLDARQNFQNSMLKRSKKLLQVRKLLKFENGMFVPSSQAQLDAINSGRELQSERDKEIPLNIEVKYTMRRFGTQSQTRHLQQQSSSNMNSPPGGNDGVVLQNKLMKSPQTNRSTQYGSVGHFQRMLYKLSQPNPLDLNHPGKEPEYDQLFKDEVYSSPRHRNDARDTMKIRYDGGHQGEKIMARSICGTRGQFQGYLSKKQKEAADLRKETLRLKAMARQISNASPIKKYSESYGAKAGYMMPQQSSGIGGFNRIATRIVDNYIDEVSDAEHLTTGNLSESSAEYSQSESNESKQVKRMVSDQSGVTQKQLRAREKHTLYERGWKRFKNNLNRTGAYGRVGVSLIGNQHNFNSPREDCRLDHFYESTQKSVSQCPLHQKRAFMMERAHQEEQQKFSNDMCRKAFIAGLRNQDYMYVQTTKNARNALYCRVSVSSQRNVGYTTQSSMNYSQILDSGEGMFEGGANRLLSSQGDIRQINCTSGEVESVGSYNGQKITNPKSRNLPNKLASEAVGLKDPRAKSLMNSYDNINNIGIRRKQTKIFDGASIQAKQKKVPPKTYQFKQQMQLQSGHKKAIYLPKVANAIKKHVRTQKRIEKQRREEEEQEAGFLPSSDNQP